MCRVIISNSDRKVGFIIYNHIFSRSDSRFTVAQLAEELREYNLDLSLEYIQNEINDFVQLGLVNQSIKYYSTCIR